MLALWTTKLSRNLATYIKCYTFCNKTTFAVLFFDKIVIFSRSQTVHIAHVCKATTLLNTTGMTHKLKICRLFTEVIDEIGQIIGPWCLDVVWNTTDAIFGLQATICITEPQSFLRYVTFQTFHNLKKIDLSKSFREFMPNIERSETRVKKKTPQRWAVNVSNSKWWWP